MEASDCRLSQRDSLREAGLEGAKLGAIDRLIFAIGLDILILSSLSAGLGTGGVMTGGDCSRLPDDTLRLRESIDRAATASPCARCCSGEMMRSCMTSCLSPSGDWGLRMCRMSCPSYSERAKLPLTRDPVVAVSTGSVGQHLAGCILTTII